MPYIGPSDHGPRHPANFGLTSRNVKPQLIGVGPFQTTAGAPIVGATVYLHDVVTGARLQTGITDASGNCIFYINNSWTCFAILRQAGSPALLAISDFTLVAT